MTNEQLTEGTRTETGVNTLSLTIFGFCIKSPPYNPSRLETVTTNARDIDPLLRQSTSIIGAAIGLPLNYQI